MSNECFTQLVLFKLPLRVALSCNVPPLASDCLASFVGPPQGKRHTGSRILLSEAAGGQRPVPARLALQHRPDGTLPGRPTAHACLCTARGGRRGRRDRRRLLAAAAAVARAARCGKPLRCLLACAGDAGAPWVWPVGTMALLTCMISLYPPICSQNGSSAVFDLTRGEVVRMALSPSALQPLTTQSPRCDQK